MQNLLLGKMGDHAGPRGETTFIPPIPERPLRVEGGRW